MKRASHALVRLYDQGQVCLYATVAQSAQFALGRLEQDAPWWDEVTDCQLTWYAGAEAAHNDLIEAVLTERPRYQDDLVPLERRTRPRLRAVS